MCPIYWITSASLHWQSIFFSAHKNTFLNRNGIDKQDNLEPNSGSTSLLLQPHVKILFMHLCMQHEIDRTWQCVMKAHVLWAKHYNKNLFPYGYCRQEENLNSVFCFENCQSRSKALIGNLQFWVTTMIYEESITHAWLNHYIHDVSTEQCRMHKYRKYTAY